MTDIAADPCSSGHHRGDAGVPAATDDAGTAMPAGPLEESRDPLEESGDPVEESGDPVEELRRALDEARETLRTIRAGGVDALVIDTGDGEEVVTLGGAERPLDELRRELEEAQETLRTIRTGGFDALVIDTGGGEEVFALGGIERPYRLVEGLAEGARTYFRAVASDFDGTMAEGQIAPDTLAALAEARARGIRVILVTGRIMSELRAAFPEIEDHVDAVVAENGAVVVTPVGVRQVAAPIGRAVSAALTARGVAHRTGQVL
ncbi:MAG TPA: HAD hydrolase family protein, partial [Streptosporangiaceae bacterium]|nr:HAD hydrolase family protein [Streptosporangiaceae bacterium]